MTLYTHNFLSTTLVESNNITFLKVKDVQLATYMQLHADDKELPTRGCCKTELLAITSHSNTYL